jgi:outer membrane protein TolC
VRGGSSCIAIAAGARCVALALALSGLSAPAGAEPLDEAISLVLAESPVIAKAETDLAAIGEQHDWTARVNIGYQAREFLSTSGDSTLTGSAGGPNAGIQVFIPLFDKRREIEGMKARASIAVTRDAVLREFVQAAAELRALAEQHAAAIENAELARDRLKYFSEAEKAGQIEPAALWPHAEAAKGAEQAARKSALAFETALDTTARKYGGDQWKKLKALLAEHAKSRK